MRCYYREDIRIRRHRAVGQVFEPDTVVPGNGFLERVEGRPANVEPRHLFVDRRHSQGHRAGKARGKSLEPRIQRGAEIGGIIVTCGQLHHLVRVGEGKVEVKLLVLVERGDHRPEAPFVGDLPRHSAAASLWLEEPGTELAPRPGNDVRQLCLERVFVTQQNLR